MKTSLLVFNILTVVPFIYLLLLFLLVEFASSDNSTNATNSADGLIILPYVFLVIAAIEISVLFQILSPRIQNAETVDSAFPLMLISFVLSESIAIYGLLIGLLDVFVANQDVQWIYVLFFTGVSVIISYYLLQNMVKPKFMSLIGTKYTPATTR